MSVLPKVVFDTQIYLRAIIGFRSACGRLVLERRSDYELFSSTQINEEIYEVLHRSSNLLVIGQHHSTKIVNVATFLGVLEQVTPLPPST